ncbi:hypothetical protein BGX29_009094 [Mortierella sp. GBA35]|nr:hypothetical protein BGX29_009094 [Mortierella sp. GBA35]
MEHGHLPPLFLGLDLSTQQLKVIALQASEGSNGHDFDDNNLQTHSSFAVHFDSELPQYHTRGGVHAQPETTTEADKGVFTTPVLMWVEALERVFDKMRDAQFPFRRVVSISGAAQQHGSVYWSRDATRAFERLRGSPSSTSLVEIFKDAFTVAESPIWQDTSTTAQCEEMEMFLGNLSKKGSLVEDDDNYDDDDKSIRLLGQQRLAELTGSRAYERYTGSQILKIVQKSPEVYRSTERISLVSSFLASVLMASFASIDVTDGSGMNLLDIRTKTWDPSLIKFIDQGGRRVESKDREKEEAVEGKASVNSLEEKLGEVDTSGRKVQAVLSQWFVSRYGFLSDVSIVTFTGDNPATVMALHAARGDAMVSLGTSDTLLLYTDTLPSSNNSVSADGSTATADKEREVNATLSVGYLCHPVDPNGYLMLYCAKNGSLAREQVRDLYADRNWDQFDAYLREGMMMDYDFNKEKEKDESRVGFYFFDREIWPPVQGVHRFENGVTVDEFGRQHIAGDDTDVGTSEAAAKRANVVSICESQFLAMRIRSTQGEILSSLSPSLSPPGISRILATGGASSNRVLLRLLANVFGVPVVSMGSTDDQQQAQVGAGSAAWGAARKAYLYGRQQRESQVTGADVGQGDGRHSGRHRNENAAILPDLTQTQKYVDRIPEFLRLEASLL